MGTIVEFCKIKRFEISIALCYLLPPIGIFFLFIFSYLTLLRNLKEKKPFHFSLLSIFFLCLLISTIGAVIEMKDVFLFVETFMILGYFGIYQRIMSQGTLVSFYHFRWIVILGGVYNWLIGWFVKWYFGWIDSHPLLGLLTGTKLLGDKPFPHYHRLIGSSYNPNFTMFLLLLAIAFLFAEMITQIRKRHWGTLVWQLVILLLLSSGVLATGSRAGFFAMLCLYFLFLIRVNKYIFIVGFIYIIFQFNRLLELMPRTETIDISYSVRKKIWLNSIEMWKEHPFFGTTSRGFKYEYMHLFDENVPHAHNIFIGFFAEYGTLGGLAFLILLLLTLYKLGTLLLNKKLSHDFLNYFLLCFPIIILTGILDEPTFSPQITLPIVILLAYWEKYTNRYEGSSRFWFKAFHSKKKLV